MWVDRGEVDFSRDEEEDGADRLEPAVAAGLALGGLEQAVEGLDEAVGLPGARPGGDAVDVAADHPGDGLHGLDFRAVHVGAPLVEHGPHDVDLPSIQNRPELLPVQPGPRGALPRDLGDERFEVGAPSRAEAARVAQQGPAQTLECGVEALLDAAGLVERAGSVGDDVELVEGDLGVGQVLGGALDERGRHVHGDRLDRLRVPAARGQLLGEPPDDRGVAALADEHHAPLPGVRDRSDVVVAAGAGRFVDGDGADCGKVGVRQREVHVALANGLDAMRRQAGQPHRRRERHLPAQGHDERLEKQREAGAPARPGRLDERHPPVRQAHAGTPASSTHSCWKKLRWR